MWSIESEKAEDAPEIEALIVRSFGPGRYAKSAYRLREGVDEVKNLSFVAREDGKLRGSVRFWPVKIGPEPALILGPLAVEPEQRGRGIGIDLMKHGIEAAKKAGHALVVLVGDLDYYQRAGFARVPQGQIKLPGPVDHSRVLALELKPGALARAQGPVLRPKLDHPVAAAGAPLSYVSEVSATLNPDTKPQE